MISLIIGIVVSLVVTIVGTPLLIRLVHKLNYGQYIRQDGPKSHLVKRGTPTLGGVVINLAVVLGWGSSALYRFVTRGETCLLYTSQFHGFIQQRNIANGKRRPFGANQCFDIAFLKPWCEATKLLRLAEQLVDKPFAGHRQPCEIQRLAQGVIHAQLLHHIRQLRLLRLVIKLVHITVAHGDQHAMHESFACFVVLLSRALGIGDGLFDIRAHDGHCESVDADRRQ